jgi:hypothetical protein
VGSALVHPANLYRGTERSRMHDGTCPVLTEHWREPLLTMDSTYNPALVELDSDGAAGSRRARMCQIWIRSCSPLHFRSKLQISISILVQMQDRSTIRIHLVHSTVMSHPCHDHLRLGPAQAGEVILHCFSARIIAALEHGGASFQNRPQGRVSLMLRDGYCTYGYGVDVWPRLGLES